MTQHGSFPGRPRGRRARQESDVPEWQGYDATPQDQREFPDLAPIRPREARARDGRGQGGQHGPGRPAWRLRRLPGRRPVPATRKAARRRPAAATAASTAAAVTRAAVTAGRGRPAPGRSDPDGAGAMAGSAGRPSTRRTAQRRARSSRRSGRRVSKAKRRRPGPSPIPWRRSPSAGTGADLTRAMSRRSDRRKRRRLLIAGGAVVALVIAVVVYLISGGPGAANLGFGNFVTNFLPGELQQVPDPCTTVPAATLNQYLPGTRKQAAPPLNSGANTQCTWTLDSAPTYRVLEVQLQAYSPSGLAWGTAAPPSPRKTPTSRSRTGTPRPGRRADSRRPR